MHFIRGWIVLLLTLTVFSGRIPKLRWWWVVGVGGGELVVFGEDKLLDRSHSGREGVRPHTWPMDFLRFGFHRDGVEASHFCSFQTVLRSASQDIDP